jgi:GMP synthase-like glutamine amidotransferase
VSGPRVLVVEHERITPSGLVSEWLRAHDAEVQIMPIDQGADQDPRGEYDLVVSLGSEFSARDDHLPWVRRELALLRDAVAADVPVLGICFGAQLLARALGGEVFRAHEPEIGWLRVQSEAPDLIPEGPWFQWHFDAFSSPPGAVELARSSAGSQAFRYGRSLGVQFHPEIDIEIMSNWASVYRHELDAQGVDAEELLAQTRRIAGAAREESMSLLEAFYDRVALLNGSPSG